MAKNVVITGATSGIGEAIVRAYLEKGENIVLTGRRIERLEALKAEFAEAFPNQNVWTFPLDVTDMTMVKTVCSDILEAVGSHVRYQCQGFDGSYTLPLAFHDSS